MTRSGEVKHFRATERQRGRILEVSGPEPSEDHVASRGFTVARGALALGALLALGAVVLAVVDLVRGHRSDTSTLLTLVLAGAGVLLVAVGLVVGRPRDLSAGLPRGGAALAVAGIAAAAIAVVAVPLLPSLRGVVFDHADAAPTLTLQVPGDVQEGDVMVAQILHSGTAPVRAPAGWTSVGATPLDPPTAGTAELFVKTATAAETPVDFTTDAPDGKIGGIAAWSNVGPPTVLDTPTGAASPLTAGPVPVSSQAPLLYFASAAGPVTVTPPAGVTELWESRDDEVFKGTISLMVRDPQSSGTTDPFAATTEPASGPWSVQVVELPPA